MASDDESGSSGDDLPTKIEGPQPKQAIKGGKKRPSKAERQKDRRDLRKYVNKQRTLIFASRGITHRDRHFMADLRDLLPHSKKDVKFDSKAKLYLVNEVAEMKNCNNCIFFEARKGKDLYMWMSRIPSGPSVKFLVENLHTMSELKLTGNCLKGSRPLLLFDKNFDESPAFRLLKEMLTQVLGSPKGHPKVKPFIDHQFSFFLQDNRIWFRNYQLVKSDDKGSQEVDTLVEIGPRFCLNPVRILSGSFGGTTLWQNPDFVTPNRMRAMRKRGKQDVVRERRDQMKKRKNTRQSTS